MDAPALAAGALAFHWRHHKIAATLLQGAVAGRTAMRALAIVFSLAALTAVPGAAWASDKSDAVVCSFRGSKEAIEDCKKTLQDLAARIRNAPNDASLYIARAEAYYRISDLPDAIADLDHAVKLQPSEGLYLVRARLRGRMGDLNGAIEDAIRALRLNPKSAAAHVTLGYGYRAITQTKRAMAEFNRAIELDPKHAEAYMARAATYSKMGDKALAEADCQRALALMPKRDSDMGYDGKGLTVRCHPEWTANP